MEVIADILENYPTFFEEKQLHMLWSAITSQWGLDILKNLDAETVALARIIVAYGSVLVESKKLYQDFENAHYHQVLCEYLNGFVQVGRSLTNTQPFSMSCSNTRILSASRMR